tara:strand:+ start:1557 stop:4895 length:3339 start_codon:yes stop_codon:yes gene_type:complete
MATSPILPALDQNFNDFYNTPLSNNPNITYSNVLSPDNMKLYTIGKSGTLQNALLESGEMTIDDLNEINQLIPTLQKRIDSYNLPPVPYAFEDKFPEKAAERRRIEEERGSRRFDPGTRGNFPADFTPGTIEPFVSPRFDEAQEIAGYGLDPDNPYDFGGDSTFKRRFFIDDALGPRRKSKKQMQYLLDKYDMKGDLSFIDPKKPQLGFRFKPEGSETYQVLNSPYIEGTDFIRQVVAEGPALVGDIAATTWAATKNPLGGKYQLPKTLLGTVGRIGGLSAAATTGTLGGEWARLTTGLARGAHDMSITEMMDESLLPALIAFGGTAIVSSAQKVLPAVYETIVGKRIPPEFYEYLAKLNAKFIQEEKGVPATSSFKFNQKQLTVKEINEQIDELGDFMGQRIRPYKPTGAGVSAADDDLAELAADFEYIFLENALNPKYKALYAEIKAGNQDIIKRLTESISSKRFKNASIEIDEAVMGRVEQKIASFTEAQNTIINKLRDPKYFDQNIDDVLFGTTPKRGSSATFPKETTNLKDAQISYLSRYTDEFNAVLNNPKYSDLRVGSTKDLQKTVGRYFNTTKTKNKIEEFIGSMDDPDIKKVFGNVIGKNRETLMRLMGKDKAGKFSRANLTLDEMFQLRTAMNQIRATHPTSGVQALAGEIEESLGKALDKGIQDHIWVNKLGNKTARTKYNKKQVLEIEKYQIDNDYGIDIANSYKTMTNAYSDTRNVLLTTLLKQGNPDKLASTVLNQGPTNVTSFMRVLQEAGDDGAMQIRKAMAKHIDDKILDETAPALTNVKNYKAFVKENQDVLKAVFGDDFKTMFNPAGFNRVVNKINKYDEKILMLKSVYPDASDTAPVFDIVNDIIRSSQSNLETGRTAAKIRFLMDTVGDDLILQEQIQAITKRFITRDILDLTKGGDGLWRINPEKLNKILNEGPGPVGLTGQTFEEIYVPLLGGNKAAEQYTKNLRLLNNIIMRESGVGPSTGAKIALKESTAAFPGATFLFRMFIAPLTQTGRRATAINRALNARAGDFMAELVANPKFLDDTLKYMEGKIALNRYVTILSSYGIVSFDDIGEELQYYNTELKTNKKTIMTNDLKAELTRLQEQLGYYQ